MFSGRTSSLEIPRSLALASSYLGQWNKTCSGDSTTSSQAGHSGEEARPIRAPSSCTSSTRIPTGIMPVITHTAANDTVLKDPATRIAIPLNPNYFDLLDVEKGYQVDQVALKKKYRNIQNQIHPDKFAQQSLEEKQLALEWSALINKAYTTLTKSVDRSQYLLELQGITISEENSHIDQSFLIEMMDLNESIDEAHDTEDIEELKARIENLIETQNHEIEQSFKADDYEGAKQSVIRLKYLLNIETKLRDKILHQNLQTK
uniref:Putative co-chaperone hscb n=1 Tax=Anopheles darlingi TaxID=43151 RepID=A0A2M4CHC4_ANODA